MLALSIVVILLCVGSRATAPSEYRDFRAGRLGMPGEGFPFLPRLPRLLDERVSARVYDNIAMVWVVSVQTKQKEESMQNDEIGLGGYRSRVQSLK